MSTPRLCDSCGEIFSELEEDWTTSTQTQMVTDKDGLSKSVSVRVDACPDCSPKTGDTIKKLRQHRRALKTAMLEIEDAVRTDPIEDGVRTDPIEDALREAENA